MYSINTLLAYRASASGKFARVLDRAIKDEMAGKPMTSEMEDSIARQAHKNRHSGVFEFAARVSEATGEAKNARA